MKVSASQIYFDHRRRRYHNYQLSIVNCQFIYVIEVISMELTHIAQRSGRLSTFLKQELGLSTGLMNKLKCILYRKPTRIRPKILGFVLFHVTSHHNTRKSLIYGHFDIRITLIIFKHRIVSGPMLFYKIAFKHKRFKLGIRNYIFKTVYSRHHLLNLRTLVTTALKILSDAVFEAYGFTYVNYLVLIIMHQINTRLRRKLFKFFFNVKQGLTSLYRIIYHYSFIIHNKKEVRKQTYMPIKIKKQKAILFRMPSAFILQIFKFFHNYISVFINWCSRFYDYVTN